MATVSDVVDLLVSRTKALGLEVSDVSLYPMTQFWKEDPREVVIIAAHLPRKACLFTVDGSISRSSGELHQTGFTINGEVTRPGVIAREIEPIGRSPRGHESFWHTQFKINTYTESEAEGFEFFREFLKKARSLLAHKFSERVHLWYVPEYSDEFENLEQKYGKHDSRIYKPFNEKVFAKLPRSIFSDKQLA